MAIKQYNQRRAGGRRWSLLAVFSLGTSLASSVAPWYERTPSEADVEQLNVVACAQPHGTSLEEMRLGSGTKDPAQQPSDLMAMVICSPHEIKDGIIWHRQAFCYGRKSEWSCKDTRTVAEFAVRGNTYKIDFDNNSFATRDVRRLAGDIFGLGVAGPAVAAIRGGDVLCSPACRILVPDRRGVSPAFLAL